MRRLILLILLTSTAAVIALGAISFTQKVRSFQPLGFEVQPRGEVWQVSAIESPETGLEAGDLMLLVNGGDVANREELERALARRSGSQILVQRGEALQEIDYRRPPLRIDFAYLMLALIGVVYLLVGTYTLLRGISAQVVLFHLWCSSSAAVYLLTETPPYDSTERILYLVEVLARLALPALTLHFFLTFPRRLSEARWFSASIPFLYLPSAVLAALHLDLALNDGAWIAGPPSDALVQRLDRSWLVLLGLYVLVSILSLVLQLLRSWRSEEGRQLLWITIGMGVGYAPFLLLYLLPRAVGLEASSWVQAVAVAPLALVPLGFAYAILRYRLWDIAIIVRDLMTYTLTVLLGIFAFSLLNLAIDRGIPEDLSLARYLLTFLAGLVVAGLAIPTRQGINSTLQRFHYRGTFSRRRALSKFGRDLLHERDLRSLSTGLLHELQDGLDLEQANLYLADGGRLVPVLPVDGEGPLPLDGMPDELWERDFESLTGIALPDSSLESAQRLFLQGYRYAFPLSVRGRRIGVAVTGYKVEQVPLNSDDVLLVRQLLNQASLAIENAQLLEQLQRQLTEVLELKQFNEEIIESSPAGIAVLDADDRVVTANLAFAALVGQDREAIRRQALLDLLPLDRLPTPDQGVQAIEMTDYLGHQRYVQLSVASFLGSSSRGLNVLVAHDVTERVQMERRLEEQERLAAIGVMAAGVAHEVNTPLTGISSYAQMLLARTPESDDRYEMLRKVERQTFRAARIVNTLLRAARQGIDEPERVDLGAVVDECCDLLGDRMLDANVSIQRDGWPEGHFWVWGNEGEYHQVISNLVVNAIDAMREQGGGTLTFGLKLVENRARLTVSDTGPGIPPTDLPYIFQPFFSTKSGSGGTGLGLSISHSIVRRYGGDLSVKNQPDGGCQFVAELPIESPASKEGSERPQGESV